MYNKRFLLVGDGRIAQYHKTAIKKLNGDLFIYDPIKHPSQNGKFVSLESEIRCYRPDYVVICSPSNLHREQTKVALQYGCNVIVEKPAVLPWETLIDDDRIHIVLQLRYLENLLSEKDVIDLISVRFVRDEEYFKTWKGDNRLTGGIFYNLFIHFIDLAVRFNARFEGEISSFGEQTKKIYTKNKGRFMPFCIESINIQDCYNRMYEDVVINKNHIKPRDIFYLNWVLDRCNWNYGLGNKNIIGKKIFFDPNEL